MTTKNKIIISVSFLASFFISVSSATEPSATISMNNTTYELFKEKIITKHQKKLDDTIQTLTETLQRLESGEKKAKERVDIAQKYVKFTKSFETALYVRKCRKDQSKIQKTITNLKHVLEERKEINKNRLPALITPGILTELQQEIEMFNREITICITNIQLDKILKLEISDHINKMNAFMEQDAIQQNPRQ